MSILDGLNPAQRQAAETIDGPVLVLAGAGSGKTRVLTYRIAYLVREIGVGPWNILAVTFTNKAAGEMRERVETLVGDVASDIHIGTFHAICARFLRVDAKAFGLDPHFTIYDEDDRRTLMRRVLKSLDIPEEELGPRTAIGQISRAKNAMLTPALFAQEADDNDRQRRMAQVYTAYETQRQQHNALDFDDLLVELVRQLKNNPEVLRKYQERFQYVLVDEYQDTNRPQYLLIQQLASLHHNLCCVGDDDQSIYQFRGADIRNILDFERDYPEAKTVRLEQNYRSTGRILAAANAVIQNNQDRKGKKLWTQSPQGEPLLLAQCDTDRREARFIVTTLRHQCMDPQYTLADAAVLYRTNAQSRALEEELQRAGFNYVIVGGIRFYERKEIKDLLAYLRLLVNPADDISLRRIINTPKRGIGDTTVEALQVFARRQNLSMLGALAVLDQWEGLNSRTGKSLEKFRDIMNQLAQAKETLDLASLGEEVFERSGYRQLLQDEGTPEAEARQQNIAQLIADLTEFCHTEDDPSLEFFLEEKSLMSSVDEADQGDALTLMTLHSAKGLEFPLVFISGMEENLFPTSRAVEEARTRPAAIEEERRLLYVGITRARQRLWLTYASRRFAYGTLIVTEPSRFLSEIPTELMVTRQEGSKTEYSRGAQSSPPLRRPQQSPRINTKAPPKRQTPQGVHYEWDEPAASKEFEEPVIDHNEIIDSEDFLAVGRWVLHGRWGKGKIIAREGHGKDMKLTILFAHNQLKRVMVAYAQLEPA